MGMEEIFSNEKAKADLAAQRGDIESVAAFLRNFHDHPHFHAPWYSEAGCDWTKAPEYNARQIIRHKHWFNSWDEYEAFLHRLRTDKALACFEQAADAICEGDEPALKELLEMQPGIIQSRSLRNHHATLLNYTGANGIEGWRQKTPANAVAIARILLDAGAETDAWGDMYGGTSTLGLVATSVHPVITGVQEPLMDLLIKNGADPNHAVAPNYTEGLLILACIHNGRYEPIHYLARHGATVDFEAACALGNLEKAAALFPSASHDKRGIGLTWACQYGHTSVVNYLLDQGLSVNTIANGTTPLLAAAFDGQLQLVKTLLVRGADMEARNSYGGTALSQTLWCLYNHRKPAHPELMELFISRGAKIEPDWLPYIEEQRGQK
ncbi:MAG: ankyrin repeat domain-containing protein [Bacteroidetes bacterium]|nr:ankyrin repeat domain-containing protein [Bacteroidota bacterium]